ncbi:hypothetical protein [Dyella sp.]|uniref:hypothetical protein n=1 Tax=Dyella sp. TaxID=1869338 RepID=UPI002FDA51A8
MKNHNLGRASLKTSLMATVWLALGMGTNTSHAQGAEIVHDPISLADSMLHWAKESEEWAKQEAQRIKENSEWLQTAEHYREVMQHYAAQVEFWNQQLIKLKGLNFEAFTLRHQFTYIEDDYGVDDACPGADRSLSGEISSALKSITPDMGGDVVKQQRDLCKLVVMTKNKKYNVTVDYLQAVADASTKFMEIEKERPKVGESSGALESVSNDVARYQADLQNARDQWDTNMKQYDVQIDLLAQVQATLSRRAIHGSPSVLGTLINAAALKAALSQ